MLLGLTWSDVASIAVFASIIVGGMIAFSRWIDHQLEDKIRDTMRPWFADLRADLQLHTDAEEKASAALLKAIRDHSDEDERRFDALDERFGQLQWRDRRPDSRGESSQ